MSQHPSEKDKVHGQPPGSVEHPSNGGDERPGQTETPGGDGGGATTQGSVEHPSIDPPDPPDEEEEGEGSTGP